eukprot:2403220-Rhodomonas_salina.1
MSNPFSISLSRGGSPLLNTLAYPPILRSRYFAARGPSFRRLRRLLRGLVPRGVRGLRDLAQVLEVLAVGVRRLALAPRHVCALPEEEDLRELRGHVG